MPEPARDRWLSIALSVVLHGTIIGLLGYGWWQYEHRPMPPPTVSIDATVVDAHTLKGLGVAPQPARRPAPQPPPVSPPQGPPAPNPQELAMRQQAAQLEAEHQAAAKAEQQRLQRERAQAKQKAEDQAKAQQVAQAKAQAKVKAKAEARKRAQARKQAEERHKRELAAARKLAAEKAAKARAARIAQLQQALQQDAQTNAQMHAAVAGWVAEVTQRVEAAWIKPPTARAHLSCTIRVVLVQGGAVSSVSLGQCNGDEAVRESIEAAVYRASPLPPLPDPSLYQQPINFVFAPDSQ